MKLIQSRYYVPNNSALVVTGDVKPEDFVKLAEENFREVGKNEKLIRLWNFRSSNIRRLTKSEGVIRRTACSIMSLIQIGWHGPSIGKDDAATYAADVFSYILTQPDSRFQRDLVDSGLTVGASIGYYTQRNVGPIQVTACDFAGQSESRACSSLQAKSRSLINRIILLMKNSKARKRFSNRRDLFDREKLSDYAHTLSFWWSSTGIDYFRGYYKNLRAISREDTNKYVRTYIQGKPHVAVALMSSDSKAAANLTEADLIGK